MNGIAKEIKEKILHGVTQEGIPVSKLSQEYGISKVTIYAWMKENGEKNRGSGYNLGELRRLKKDKEDLLLIIGELTAELNKTKKKKSK